MPWIPESEDAVNYVISPEATAQERLKIEHKGQDTAQPGVLTLLCRTCTRFERFVAADRTLATIEAHRKGWAFRPDGKCICPRCPK